VVLETPTAEGTATEAFARCLCSRFKCVEAEYKDGYDPRKAAGSGEKASCCIFSTKLFPFKILQIFTWTEMTVTW